MQVYASVLSKFRATQTLDWAATFLAAAGGALCVVAFSLITGQPIPCQENGGCDVTANLPIASVLGVPVSYLGVGIVAILLVSCFWARIRTPAIVLGFVAVAESSLLQLRTDFTYRMFCMWCFVSLVLLAVGTALLIVPSRGRRANNLSMPLAALGMSWVFASLFPNLERADSSYTDILDLSRFSRMELCGDSDPAKHVMVFIGSPNCSSCADKFPEFLKSAQGVGANIHYGFAPVTPNPKEVELGIDMKAALDRNDMQKVSMLESPIDPERKLNLAQAGLSTAEFNKYKSMCEDDANLVLRLHVKHIPLILDCKENLPCKQVN
jgi:uncharacterized membrane protein